MASFVTPPVTKTLGSSENAWTQISYFTRWMPSAAVKNVSALIELQDVEGAMRVTPCYQLATTDTDEPDSPTVLGTTTTYSTAGVHYYALADVDADLDDGYFVRFGVFFRTTTDDEWASATVTATFSGSSN